MNKIKYSILIKDMPHGMKKVCIRCEQFNSHIDIDTKVHIFDDEWDDEKGLVVNNPNAKELNILIRKTLYQMEEIELGYESGFTLSKLKEIWDGNSASYNFYDIVEYQIEHRDLKESTRAIHRRILVHLKRYRPKCSVHDLTVEYVKGFIRYMKDIGLCENTQRMHLNMLKCYYGIVRKMFGEKVPSDTFDFYHVSQAQQINFHIKPLDEDDVRKIENYTARPETPTKFIITLHRFLFMIYTGVRISDFQTFSANNFTVENGETWLTYTSVKTNTFVRVPISTVFDNRAVQILSKYHNALDRFFDLSNRDSFNQRLKIACKHVGITKNVSAHVARHTFATRLINKGVPVTTIQQVIGHRSLKMTMVYAKTNEQTLIRQLG